MHANELCLQSTQFIYSEKTQGSLVVSKLKPIHKFKNLDNHIIADKQSLLSF